MLIGTIAGQERDDRLVVACAGVGYSVTVGKRDRKHVEVPNKAVTIYARQTWDEANGPQLFGWLNERDRALFDRLVKVQGVGPKGASRVVDVFDIDDLLVTSAAEIARRCDGIGKVLAFRIAEALEASS